MKEKPPWINDPVSLSREAKRLQELCDNELKRRTGIPKEHWRYVGMEDSSKTITKPHLKLVEVEVEILEPAHGGGGGGSLDKQKPSWDFYFLMGIIGGGFMLVSYFLVEGFIWLLRGSP